MSDNNDGGSGGLAVLIGLGWLLWTGVAGVIGYFFGNKAKDKAYEDGKAQGYKEASEEYEAKLRKQAEEFLNKTKELEELLKQQKEANQELKEKVEAYLEEGARLIGEYEGLEKRYNELNKKLSKETQAKFSSIKNIWDNLKKAA